MKNSILTMFFIVLIIPLSSATAGEMAEGFTPGLCTGGSVHATEVWAKRYAPPLLNVPESADITAYCADACSKHLVGCDNVAKTAAQCRLGLTNDLLRQAKEECTAAEDISACKQAAVQASNDRKGRIQSQKAEAEAYCDDVLPSSCLQKCTDSLIEI